MALFTVDDEKHQGFHEHFQQAGKTIWSKQLGKIVLTAGQFVRCPDLNETPRNMSGQITCLMGFMSLCEFVI